MLNVKEILLDPVVNGLLKTILVDAKIESYMEHKKLIEFTIFNISGCCSLSITELTKEDANIITIDELKAIFKSRGNEYIYNGVKVVINNKDYYVYLKFLELKCPKLTYDVVQDLGLDNVYHLKNYSVIKNVIKETGLDVISINQNNDDILFILKGDAEYYCVVSKEGKVKVDYKPLTQDILDKYPNISFVTFLGESVTKYVDDHPIDELIVGCYFIKEGYYFNTYKFIEATNV